MIDAETYAEVQQLFARYCHLADANDADGWAALFCEDARFEVPSVIELTGQAQLRAMPGIIAQQGGGRWRHQITCIACEGGTDSDILRVKAYGLVTDWAKGGSPASFTDYEIDLRREHGTWRIAGLIAHQV